MNSIVKWIMVTLVCTIFALDCIVLLSLQAGAVVVCQEPVANFTSNVTSGCTRMDVQFTDQPTNYPMSWFWDFGDSGTALIQNPIHRYANPGTYTVKLNVTNSVALIPEPNINT